MTREEFEIAKATPMCRKCMQRAESILRKDLPRRPVMTESYSLGKPRLTTVYQREYSDLCFYHAREREREDVNWRRLRFREGRERNDTI